MLRSSYAKAGPHEFSNYIRTRYPSILAQKLGILLREQNARGLANISEMHQAFQSNMFNFTDKLMACLAENCTCCKTHGNKTCILGNEGTNTCDAPPHVSTDQTQFSTPLVSKTGPRLPAPGNPGACLSVNSFVSSKRDGSLSSSIQSGTSKETCSRKTETALAATPTCGQNPLNQIPISQDATVKEIASKNAAFYDDLTSILVTYYAEIRPAPGFILFGSTIDGAHVKIDLPQCNFGRDPWVAGLVLVPPIPTVLRAIKDWMSATSMLNLERKDHIPCAVIFLWNAHMHFSSSGLLTASSQSNSCREWIVHPKPRLITLEVLDRYGGNSSSPTLLQLFWRTRTQ
ncbi:uncharacterized protein [Triticum aestivum]|uniref:uncharacterized protein n=1 Tax=Triticum aestivum TaxID=4565 RepID=UPI001D0347F7|nr:uncharacterized protein LOC123044726 [Triticum aestivum]XP_044323497.1 uncharacterized protein LOC123044726 [Triticum aestivum]XP_044323498.1 uncharacterized protein LOC123044726 [Triticum aestivum]XP_044323499.1 uncharacterized protein LOC123044726 [Triticum aestivum]XP_044323500.1 uncharacterized protein LOC123044726 [Triticum aestivum]